MKRKRIGVDVRLWNETGVGRYIRNLVEQLHQIKSENEYILFALEKDKEFLTRKFNRENWRVVVSDIHWHTIAEQTTFPRIIEKEKLDLMHFTYFSVPIGYKGKFVVTMHDMIPFSVGTGKASTLPFPLYSIKRTAYKYIVTQALKKAQVVIVPTRAVQDDILHKVKIDKKKIEVVYEGTSKFAGTTSAKDGSIERYGLVKEQYFLYVGNAYPHKNIEKLLEAFLQLNSKHSEYKLCLVGKKDYFYKRILESPTAIAIGDSLKYIESPTDEELYGLYKNALSFISISKMEGFALPALEAMSLGVLVTLSDIPVFREVCKGAPIQFTDPNDSVGICNSLEFVINSANKTRVDHIKLGRIVADSYSWKDMASKTLAIYNDISESYSA